MVERLATTAQPSQTPKTAAPTSPPILADIRWPPVWSQAVHLQPKLTVNQPGDAYEQEADRVAQQVTAAATPVVDQASPAGSVMRQSTAADGSAGVAPPLVHQVLQSPGRPLDPATRHALEPRFGQDFSHVRVHDDPSAAASASAVQARAYTVGRDVVFGAGQYAPHTTEGQRLLAHELTHVVQQQPGVLRRDGPTSSGPSVSMPSLTTLLFRYGDASLRVNLPTSVTASLPVALRNVGVLTFSLSADIPNNFAFSVTLDTRPHLRISTRVGYNRETGEMSAGLVVQTTTTTCTIPDASTVQRNLQAAGDRLTTAIQNFLHPPETTPAPSGGSSGLSLPPEIDRARELGTAIYDLYDRARNAGAGQRCVTRPVWSLEFGARVPLQPTPSQPPIFGPEDRERQPSPYLGGTFTWHF